MDKEPKHPLKALVVEDDSSVALPLCTALRQHGYAARHAPDADTAINKFLREESFHLIICDLLLPGESGLALLIKLREGCPASYIVLLTAYGNPATVAAAFKRGAVEFI